jgi:predicted CopG family antitoxin
MAKRLRVTVTVEDDILVRLRDLHKQATEDRSHYDVINEITALRKRLDLPT